MMDRRPNRRGVLGALAALSALPARADEVVELEWGDLAPGADGALFESLRALGVIQHGQLATPFDQETGARLTHAYDGQRVRLHGFAIPLDFDGVGVTTLVLAPFVGACIHVPPPPPNQLVLVTAARPYRSEGLFEPVTVEGTFQALAAETSLAEIGYSITEAHVALHYFDW